MILLYSICLLFISRNYCVHSSPSNSLTPGKNALLHVHHSIDNGFSYHHADTIQVSLNSQDDVTVKRISLIPDDLTDKLKTNLESMCDSKEDKAYMYRFKFVLDNIAVEDVKNENEPSTFFGFADPCHFLEAGGVGYLTIHLGWFSNVMSINFTPKFSPAQNGNGNGDSITSFLLQENAEIKDDMLIYDDLEATNNNNVDQLPPYVVDISARSMLPSLQPDTVTYIQRMEEEKMKEKHDKTKGGDDNRSFLVKYWMYIVPVLLILFINAAGSQEEPEQGGGGGQSQGSSKKRN